MTPHKHAREDWEGYKKPDCVELGPTCCIQVMGRYGKPEEYVSGFIIAHDVPGEPYRCEGAVNVDPELTKDGKIWQMSGSVAEGNLTLTPSVLCSEHEWFHAFVTNGRWTG